MKSTLLGGEPTGFPMCHGSWNHGTLGFPSRNLTPNGLQESQHWSSGQPSPSQQASFQMQSEDGREAWSGLQTAGRQGRGAEGEKCPDSGLEEGVGAGPLVQPRNPSDRRPNAGGQDGASFSAGPPLPRMAGCPWWCPPVFLCPTQHLSPAPPQLGPLDALGVGNPLSFDLSRNRTSEPEGTLATCLPESLSST